MLPVVRRAALGLTTSLTTATLVLSGLAAPAQAADLTDRADRSADWLAEQLEGGLLQTDFGPNYGTTLDVALAYQTLDTRNRRRDAVLDAFAADPDAYVGAPDASSAGGLGKLLTVVQQEGIRPRDFAQGGLLGRLQDRVVTRAGDTRGWARDAGSSDFSNTVTQSYVVRALALADDDLTGVTTRFLLKQQCDPGWFRVFVRSADHTCEGGTAKQSSPSVDATGFAVLALLEARPSLGNRLADRATRAVAEATRWLARRQAGSGAFTDTGRTDGVRNSNSTGVAAQALAATGKERRAQRAGAWVAGLRVTRGLARTTSYRAGDVGAIAFTRQMLRDGKDDGITGGTLFYFHAATAQALASQDLPLP